MILAELTAEGWVLVVGAIFVGLTNLAVKVSDMVVSYFREKDKIEREGQTAKKVDAVAAKVDAVAQTAKDTTAAQVEAAAQVVEGHVELMAETKKQTVVLSEIKGYVNGWSTTQLQTATEALAKLAESEPSAENIAAANAAKAYLDRHIANQPK